MEQIDAATRNRLRGLWTAAWTAERDFVNAELAFDQGREQVYDLGDAEADLVSHHAQGEGGLKMDIDDVSRRRDEISGRRDAALLALRSGYARAFGPLGDQLIDELLKAIEACYEPGGTSFRQPITGERGEQVAANVQAVKDRINALVDGDPIMVDPSPND